jgi:hypothetical protein
MRPVKALVASYPNAAYFALTFTISWGGVLPIIVGPAGMTGVKAQDQSGGHCWSMVSRWRRRSGSSSQPFR